MKTLAERLEETRARRKAAESAITEADKAEIQMREEMAREEAAAREAEEQRRALALARRLDAARERMPEGTALRELAIKDSEHTFVIAYPGSAAYNTWEKGIAKSVTAEISGGKPVDRASINRDFAVASVVDWNGITDFSGATTNGSDLIDLLKAHPPIATEIVNVAAELGKVAKEARKS